MKKFQPIGIMTTDLHLTDKGEDNYRFDIFNWIIENYGDKLTFLFILGDLTDRKNHHADHLVDKMANEIHNLTKYFNVLILRGNHDYEADPSTPFFGFLGKMNRVTYFRKPTLWRGDKYGWNCNVLFLPHSREPGKDWNLKGYKNLDAICLHQTFKGAKSESGYTLGGIGTAPFRHFTCPIFSGDVHAPQNIKNITYVGSPYHVHFGDKFEPRLFIFDEQFRTKEIYFPAPHKLAIDIPHAENLLDSMHNIRPGDRAKIRLHLPADELSSWPIEQEKIRKIAKDIDLVIDSISLKELDRGSTKLANKSSLMKRRNRHEVFEDFCKRNQISKELMSVGETLLED